MQRESRAPLLQALFTNTTAKHYEQGDSLGSTDDSDMIMFIVKGYVKRYMIRNDGVLGVQIIYGAEDIFSLTHLYDLLLGQELYEGPEAYYYSAIGDTTILSLKSDIFRKAVQNEPFLYRELFSEAGRHLKACVHNIENTSLHSIYTRVAHQLAFLLREFGESVESGIKLRIPLTHQDLADMLGVTRTSVSVAVGKLRDKHMLLTARYFTTPDLDALTREAYN